MRDEEKTKEQLLDELTQMRQRIAELEASEIKHRQIEQALRESEERYRSVVENSNAGILVVDDAFRLIYANDELGRILRHPREEIIGQDFRRFLDERSREIVVDRYVRRQRGEEPPPRYEFSIVRKGGEKRHVEISSTLIRDSAGNVQTVGQILDVTERKRAEEALKRSEERYALAQQAANIGSWDWDIRTGDLHWSDQIEPMFGFDRGEFGATYEAFLESVHPDDRQYVIDSVNACVEEGQEYAIEHRIVWPDRTVRWVSEMGDVFRDENGEAIRMLGIVQDITGRKQAEEALRIKDSAIASSINAIAFADLEGNLTYANDSFLEMWGYDRQEEILGEPAAEFWQAEEEAAQVVEALRSSGSCMGELVAKRRDGSLFDVQLSASMVTDLAGKPLSMMSSFVDITDRKQAEEEIGRLARFPGENPYPVLRVAKDGTILYANKASSSLLDAWKCQIGQPVPGDWHRFTLDVLSSGSSQETEVEVEDRILSLTFAPIVDADYVNVYGLDITERKRAEEALSWEAGVNAAIAELSRALISEQTIDDISFLVLEQAKRLTGSAFGYVGYIDPRTGHLVTSTMTRDIWETCQVEDKDTVFEKFCGLWGWVLENRQPLLVNSRADDPRSSGTPPGHIPIHRFLSAPALIGEELVGQVALANPGRDYTEQDLALVERLASFYAVAIQRKRGEEALRQSEKKYRNLFEYANDSIFIIDPSTRRFLDANEIAARRLGYTREELLQLTIDDIDTPMAAARNDAITQQLQETSSAIFEHAHQRKDGTEILVEVSSRVIEYGDQQVFQSLVRDITERKQAEEHLRVQGAALESAANGIVITDREGTILWANPAFTRLTGYAPEEALGQNPRLLKSGQQDFSFYRHMWNTILAGQVWHGEVVNRRKDGTLYTEEMTITPVRDEHGQITHFIAIKQDVTERRRAEEALRQYTADLEARNEELDAFAHTVAHDLKGPLSIVIGYADMLEEDEPTLSPEELQKYVHTIARNGRKMSKIIDDLLLLSGVRQMEVELYALDMATIVVEARQRLVNMIEEYQAEIILPETWPAALGYGPWIEEVWANYLSNALKYGGRPPRVELGATVQPDGRVRFWVCDNGPGLTPQEQSRLFTPFTRLDQVRAKGHGLGLSIVRRIVEKLGGQVGVESKVSHGSAFTFTLPGPASP